MPHAAPAPTICESDSDADTLRQTIRRLLDVGAAPVAIVGHGQRVREALSAWEADAPDGLVAVIGDGARDSMPRWLPRWTAEEAIARGVRGVIMVGDDFEDARALWSSRRPLRLVGIDVRVDPPVYADAHWDHWLLEHDDVRRAAANGVRLDYDAPWPAREHPPHPALLTPLLDRLTPGGRAGHLLEIGPGSGLYTGEMLNRCERMTLVDGSERLLFECLERRFFQRLDDLTLTPASDGTLPGVEANSLDGVFSVDCFVHIKIDVVHAYLASIARALRPGGVALLHCKDWDASEIEAWEGTARARRVYATTHFASPSMLASSAQRLGLGFETIPVYASSYYGVFTKPA